MDFFFNNFLLHVFMNDNQSLVVHSRWVYNFVGIILEPHVSLIFFSLLCTLFKKLVSDFGDFQTLCGGRDRHRESTTCKWVCEMNRGIHCKSGSSFMGLAVDAGLSISNEERQNILHSAMHYKKFDYHSWM